MRLKFVSLLAGLLFWPCLSCAADDAWLAWLRDGQVEMRSLNSTPSDLPLTASSRVPLGSLWKLFVYAWLVDGNAREPDYVCAPKGIASKGEDQYCCESGQSVARNTALARSCAAYFAPGRIGLTNTQWRGYWQKHSSARWLTDLKGMRPDTQVSIAELLQVLGQMSPRVRTEARKALLDTGIAGYGREAWPQLGSGIRYKTYSWHRPDGRAFGGAAGWLADGTPFWFGARGSSRTALKTWAARLAANMPEARWGEASKGQDDISCVDVEFFARYPLKAVWQEHDKVTVKPGVLRGRYRLEFANGNWLGINAAGLLTLHAGKTPVISGRFTMNDYVARVVEREGNTGTPQAARALAIAARSYLVQNGRFQEGCWRISDASNTQRVSPNPPGKAALAAAWFSDDVVLSGAVVRYHRDEAGPNRMSWKNAVEQDKAGQSFERILAQAYPKAVFSTLGGQAECRRLGAAERWLTVATAGWKRKLQREPGFDALTVTPHVCALNEGHPYSDQRRMRIYARGWRSLEERITLAHEYLHLVFRFHPNGADEAYVERMARRLVEG